MLFRKENGFSLVEVMILFVVMSAILAASIATISRRSTSVPIKIARGAYICYMDANGNLHEEVFNRKQKLSERLLGPGESCVFHPVKQAAAYQITLIGAGAGGFNSASISNANENPEVTYFKMSEGFTGAGVDDEGNVSWKGAATMSDGKTIGRISDEDLWKYYNGEHLTVTASVPGGQNGHKITACFLKEDSCACYVKGTQTKMSKPTYGDNLTAVDLSAISDDLVFNQNATTQVLKSCEYPNLTNCNYYFQKVTQNRDVTRFNRGDSSMRLPTPEEVCEGRDNLINTPLSWGGQWYCTCQDKTVEGEEGGAGGYLTNTTELTSASLVNAYELDTTSSKPYQDVLKKFADNMKVGICSDPADGDTCTYAEGTAYPPSSGSDLNLGHSNNSCSGKCEADNGGNVAQRVAIVYPDYSEAAKSTDGATLKFQTVKAKGGYGAVINVPDGSQAGGSSWEVLDFSQRTDYVEREKDAAGPLSYENVTASYRPMLEFVTNLSKRQYMYGQPGSDGGVIERTRVTIKGDCNIKVGTAGKAHEGSSSEEYMNYTNYSNGDTTIACTKDEFSATAKGGQPSAAYNTHEYQYSVSNADLQSYEVIEGALSPYQKPVALLLLQKRGFGDTDFGKGGDGVTMIDRCIKPRGTFTVTKKNEYDGTLVRSYVAEEYEDPGCMDINTYGTVMQNLQKDNNGGFTSRYLDVNAAKDGQNGAVIITW